MATNEAQVERSGRPERATVLSAWYDEHAASVYRFALHLAGTREDAEDVVQFCFLQAHRALVAGTGIENPRAWLMTTAKRRWLTVVRDRHDVPFDPTVLAESAAGRDENGAADELASVRASLWTLPAAQHEAFVLRHWSGLSQNEIADVLGTSTTAVESLLTRARMALLADRGAADTCRTVRERLAAGAARPQDDDHLTRCRRCRVARERLSAAMGIASVLSLAPGRHVAEALASTIPGFSASGVSAGAGSAVAATGGGSAAAVGGGAVPSGGLLATGAGKLIAAVKVATVVGAVATAATMAHPSVFNGAAQLFERPLHALVAGQGTASKARGAGPSHPASPGAAGRADAQARGGNAFGPGGSGQVHGKSAAGHGKATPPHGNGAGHGTSAATGAGKSHGNGKAKGAPATKASSSGSSTSASHGNGKAKGKSGTAGGGQANGNGQGKGAGASGGSNGKGNGASGGSNGNGKGAGKG